jgi:hypothetical protein
MILPILPGGRPTSATIGPPVPAAAGLGKELRRSLPVLLAEALEKIGSQIEVEILDPLLCADSAEQLAKTFERVFPKFRDYYISTLLITWGVLQEDAQRLSSLTIRSYEESEDFIRSRGPHWIGREASLNALHATATMIRIAKAAARLFDVERSVDPHADGDAWANSMVAFGLAFSAVLVSLTALENGRTSSSKFENVSILAHWSRGYAVQAYHFTKRLGLVKPVRPTAPIAPSDEEDTFLAEAGLDEYAEALARYDQP